MKRLNITFGTILLVLGCFAFSQKAQAVSPPPDGGYPNGNTAEGDSPLFSLISGADNTAIGAGALFSNTSGSNNTATGFQTLNSNTTASNNTANGFRALLQNTTGNNNTANGFQALFSNRTGIENTATGTGALQQNIGGDENTATGTAALQVNTSGMNNTANGFVALLSNTTGGNNTANGSQALQNNTTGSSNIAVGSQAGSNLTTGSNNIDIGALGSAGEANTIRIGKSGIQTKTFIQGIRGATVANGVGVIVGTTGQLGTVQSSRRFKEAIKPMDKTSEAILALKPVSFRYKDEFDPDRIPQFGLLAEDVEKVNPDLVVRDENGDLSSVRYEAVNAMLLNEFLKEHSQVQLLKTTVAQQQKQIETLSIGLQKVSAQLQLTKTAPRTVLNNQ